MNPVVFNYRKDLLSRLPRQDRQDVERACSQYIRVVQDVEDWKLSEWTIEVVTTDCTSRKKAAVCHVPATKSFEPMLSAKYSLIEVSPYHFDKYGTDYMKIVRHELAHVECYIEYGQACEDSPEFNAMLKAFDAPKDTTEL